MSAQIFLSYSHEDKFMMEQVRDSLETRNLKIWTDEDLELGTPVWQNEIQKALDTVAALVVIMTPSSRKSTWVTRELSYADENGVRIFPLLAAGNKKESIPFQLNTAQYIDIRTGFGSGIDRLVISLNNHLGIDANVSQPNADYEKLAIALLGNFAHDILAPLQASRGFIALIRMRPEKQELFLDRAESAIAKATEIVDEILEISRIARGILPQPEFPLDITGAVDNVVMQNQTFVDRKELSLSIVHHQVPLQVAIEMQSAQRIFDNLLSNAIDYTRTGTIHIETRAFGHKAVFTIKDSGIGIPQKEQSRIFQRFFRGENASEMRSNGTGLGLSLVKDMVEYYHGSITFESIEGIGTIFSVQFPLVAS